MTARSPRDDQRRVASRSDACRAGEVVRRREDLMIALVQRVSRAQVTVGGEVRGRIDHGLLVFVCAEPADSDTQAAKLVDKLLKLRVFADDAGKMNRSVQDVDGGLLIVSQF